MHLSFIRDTLTDTRVIDFFKDKNILLWCGNVRESEAHKGKWNPIHLHKDTMTHSMSNRI